MGRITVGKPASPNIFATFLQYENNCNLKLAAAADAATVTIFVLSGRNDRDRSACPSLADALA